MHKANKKSIKIVDGEVRDAIEVESETDNLELFINRMKSYSNNSATKTPEVTHKVDAPPRDRQYNLNLGANNIKRYGFLGEPDSGNESGKANANKFIIVDPAGTAFEGVEAPLDKTGAAAGSAALYAIFKKRPTMPLGETKEGVKVNAKNEITTIEAGYAVYNNFSAGQSGEFYGIIHAVGPKGKKYEEQLTLLTKCLENVFFEYHTESSKVKEETNRPGIRIPCISGGLYGIPGQAPKDYAKMFGEALEKGFDDACKRVGKQIEFGKHGLEICMYSQVMYNPMLGEITKVPNPAISPVDAKAMEPKEKIKGGK